MTLSRMCAVVFVAAVFTATYAGTALVARHFSTEAALLVVSLVVAAFAFAVGSYTDDR